jgi:hypothetical protein
LTETLTYTAPTGGLSNGTLTVAVPPGWTAPSTSAGPGYTTASVGTVSVLGQTITVSGVSRTAAQTVVITYGSGATATAAAGPGAQSWQVKEASTVGGALSAIAVSPSITIYAPDGSGTATTPTTNVSASQAGNTVVFTYTAATGDMLNGAVKLTIPTGWSAPSVSAVAAGYTTASTGAVAVAAQVVTVSGVTLTAGSTLTITYGSKAGGGAGATATATAGAQIWQLQERSTAAGILTNIGTSPSVTVNAANGSGTLTSSVANVSASQSGRTITFTYTAAAGAVAAGAVTVTAPAGWTAPSTISTDPGYTTASTGTVSAAGQTITVSGVTLAGGGTMTIVYGNTGGGGPGATASATLGAQTWQGQEKSTLAGVLANLAASPSIVGYAADGTGTATTSISVVSAGQTGRTVTLTYTAATGGMLNGTLSVDVPAGWTAPATIAGPGYSTTSVGTLSVSGQTITVTGATRTAGQTVVITYGSGATATAPATTGAQTWQLRESSTAAGSPTSIAVPPSITVYANDGSGTLTSSLTNVSASQIGNTNTLTFTAGSGGMSGGTITVVVPTGWSAPSTVATAAGYTTASTGTVTTATQTITVSAVTLGDGATATITYGSKAGGGAGATASATTGPQTWQAKERSTAAGVLTNVGTSPSIVVNAANGSGTTTVLPANVGNGSTGNTLTFTYTAATGGVVNGTVTVTAPTGWSAPSTTSGTPGYTTASTGTVSVAGQTITVNGVTLSAAGTMTIAYGNTTGGGAGATAGTSAGANAFQTQEMSTAAGVLANLAASPSVNVYSADGSGTMTSPTTNVVNGSSNTVVFTYKAAVGGIAAGALTLTAPAGWPAPTAANTTSSAGTRSYAGQTVTVSNLTLAANATFTITYGPALAPTTGGPQTWSTSERSTTTGTIAALAASPSINIYAQNGSGTLTGLPSTVGYGSAGNTESFTYAAATGGTLNGAVTIVVPAGWSAPSTTSGNAGYTVSSTGTVSVAAQTITVSSVTLASGATLTRHLRQRLAGCNCSGRYRFGCVGGEIEDERGRHVDEPRLLADHDDRAAAELHAHLPRRIDALRHGVVDGRLRDRRHLRHRGGQFRRGPSAGRGLDPPGIRQLLGRQRLLECVPGVRSRDGNRELVGRVPGLELPRRRRVHRADEGTGQPERHRNARLDDIHDRPDPAERVLAQRTDRRARDSQRPDGVRRRRLAHRCERDPERHVQSLRRRGRVHVRRGNRCDRHVDRTAVHGDVELATSRRRVLDRRAGHRQRRQHDGLPVGRGRRRQHDARARTVARKRHRRISRRRDAVLQGRRGR